MQRQLAWSLFHFIVQSLWPSFFFSAGEIHFPAFFPPVPVTLLHPLFSTSQDLVIFFRAVKNDSLCKRGRFGFKLGDQFLKSLFLLLMWSKVPSSYQERRARKKTMNMLGYKASYFHSNSPRMKI